MAPVILSNISEKCYSALPSVYVTYKTGRFKATAPNAEFSPNHTKPLKGNRVEEEFLNKQTNKPYTHTHRQT